MHIDWKLTAAIAAFALAGGWLGAHVATSLARRPIPPWSAMVCCGLLGIWTYEVVFGTTALLLSLCLAWALFVLAVVDWLNFRLPDLITLPLIACGLVAAALLPAEHVLDHAIAAAIAYAVLWIIAWAYRRLRGKEGLGMGDAKLAAAAGAWLGLEPLPSVLLLASTAGILWVLVSGVVHGREALSRRIPFGVPLSVAIWIVWLYGPLVITAAG